MASQEYCKHCGKGFATDRGVEHHIAKARECREAARKEFQKGVNERWGSTGEGGQSVPRSQSPQAFPDDSMDFGTIQAADDLPYHVQTPPPEQSVANIPGEHQHNNQRHLPEKGEAYQYVTEYRASARAGEVIGREEPENMRVRAKLRKEETPFGPFEDLDEFELAEWLLPNVGQGKTDEYLKLPIVRSKTTSASRKFGLT